ncbi:phage tail tape measure protein [Desulfuromonas thiophila]|uniref:Phage tail tape measure protein, TP901 family, core region n=1 Tax=Desulfuromonas thiophila TaxID=57664 RepID=A0A1G7B145_9BACT|nr:phage tail tape measure protein [Desulfuromonas thiophila]SDE20838.1 phage tail tape measure protein, TP901 family, core region [Desulfuromonas thiophila]
MRLGTADVVIRAKTDQYKKDLKSAENTTQQFGQRSLAAVRGVTTSFASLAGVAGIGGLATAMVSTGARFESEMATVRGVMRASEQEFQALAAAAKQAGETTEWSATQSAEALKYMGMAGWSAEQAVAALPGVLNLATAGGLDLGRASDIVTDSLTAMGMGVQDLSRFNDVLVGTITRSNTNIEMMGESMRYAAPIASQLGYDVEQLAALIGTLANAGIKASDSGTDLRQAMVRNKKAARELGTAETDLIGTLKAAKAAGWGVNEVTENYGMIASKSVLVLMNQLDGYHKLEGQLRNVRGETDALAKVKLDTVAGDFKTLKSAIEGVGIASFEAIEGDLRRNLQDLTDYVRQNRGELVDFARNATEIGRQLVVIAGAAGELSATVLEGWNALPAVVREAGFVGAILGGKKGAATLTGYLLLIGQAKQYFEDLAAGVSAVDLGTGAEEVKGQIADVEAALEKYRRGSRRYKNSVGGLVYAQQQQQNLQALKQHLAEIERQGQAAASAVRTVQTPPTPTAETKTPNTGGDAAAKAYQSAYSSMERITQATYDAMQAKYRADRDAFIADTGDKVTAAAYYAEQMAELNRRMNPKAPVDPIEQQIAALKEQAETFGMSAKAAAIWRLEQEQAGTAQIEATRAVYEAIEAKERDSQIEQQIAALKEQAETFGMSAKAAAIWRLEQEQAGTAQIEATRAVYEAIEAKERDAKAEAEGIALKASLRTETERLADELKHLDELYRAEAISAETYGRAVMEQAGKGFTEAPSLTGFDDYGEGDRLSQQSEALEQWYSEQLDLLEQYRQQKADLNAVWDEREAEVKRQHEAGLARIEGTRYQMALSSASAMFGGMAEMTAQFAGEQSEAYKAMFAVSKAFAIAESTVNLWAAIAKAGNNPWPLNLAAMASVAAAMGGLVSNIAAVGMAHDGIDSVPKSGTWLLEKGERVTTAETSAKLDRVLSRIDQGQGTPGPAKPMNVSVYEAPGTTSTTRQRDDGGLDVIIEQVEREIVGRMDRGTGVAGYFDRRYGRRY